MKHGIWLGLLAAGLAQGGEDTVSGEDVYGELPVVLTASRLRQPLSEAPNAMTVIDRKMIEASGFRDIPDLFKLVPGMYVGYYKGHQAFVGYHGSPDQYSRRMQVMIDGSSVYLPPSSMVSWADLPITIDDIERIEVIRGPAAASHGANSTQGVISIITRDAGEMHGGRVAMTRGEKGINDASIRFGRRGKDFDYRMTVAYTADNGFDNLSVAPPTVAPAAILGAGLLNNSHDSNQARMLNYRGDYRPDGVDSYELQLGFSRDIRNVGWTDSLGNPVHDLISNSGSIQLGWTRALENSGEFRLRYYHLRHAQHEAFPLLPGLIAVQPVMQSVDASRDDIELQHTIVTGDANRLVYGAAWRADSIDGQYSSLQPVAPGYASQLNGNEWRVFAHDEWRLGESLLLNGGAMYEHDRLQREHLSPRVALNFHVAPQHTFRIGTSVAYRTPSFMESNGPVLQPGELWVINATPSSPDLQSEKLHSREIGYVGEFRDWGATLDLRLYSDLLSGGVTGDGGGTPFRNNLSAEYRGFEATLKQQVGESGNLIFNYARASASSNAPMLAAGGLVWATSACPQNPDLVSCSIPKNGGSALYSHSFRGGVTTSIAMYFQDSMQPQDRGMVDFQPTQRRTDVRLAKAFSEIGGIKGSVAVVVQNLFDQQYTDYVANSLNQRRAFVTLGLDW